MEADGACPAKLHTARSTRQTTDGTTRRIEVTAVMMENGFISFTACHPTILANEALVGETFSHRGKCLIENDFRVRG